LERTDRIPAALLALRVGIFILMFVWIIDKLVRPQHAAHIFEQFYGLKGMGNAAVYTVAVIELLVLAAFLLGLWKRFSYGAVLVFHAISTLSSFRQYFAPFQGPNLLFFAAWPALAACLALYWLRDLDTALVLGRANPRTALG
jgi:putative oxidoreductase